MDNRIEKLKKVRQFLLAQIEGLTAEQLNKIPSGYTNNIVWNLAHLLCAQQSICYIRGGQPVVVPEKYIAPFFTTTKPERFIDEDEIQEIKSLFITTIDQLQVDYENRLFDSYTPSPNIVKLYGIHITGINDALEFLLYHEGYHSGYIVALKRLVGALDSVTESSAPLFYHGTKANLKEGDLIKPGFSSNYGARKQAAFVYLTATLEAATWGAELAWGDERGRIYIVKPTGSIEDDPNLTDKKFPGNPTKSYRTRHPLRVIGEVADWQGHSADQLKAMKDHLERLKQQGIEAIED